ncbi:gasdermin-E [Conger conger]|uniref:gasdermin-E n=1 Tax=Conger conger TaxID=82655 RepID=UPI002A5A85CE|nr:gasdermin-E [Conger conger]XP_061112469.1 gasdermin-E [Conger conger]XP_061112470.1 gasdermin-E [Conger conger]XP_061112471.1 gasdermin-E [Conger conger]
MLAQATGAFVQQIDPGGTLIPLTRINDSEKLDLLALVLKSHGPWFWQRTKYRPTDFTLNDLLLGDTPISTGVLEKDFLKYEGTFGDSASGRLECGGEQVSVNVQGKGSSKLQSSFGNLRKQEVDVPKLLQDSHNRRLNPQHGLLRLVQGRGPGGGRGGGRGLALAVLKERIVSTQPCSITQQTRRAGSCSAMLPLITTSSVQVSVQEKGSLQKDSNISLEIPEGSVLAYSVLELDITPTGHYEFCLQLDTEGGFEVDGPIRSNGEEHREQPISILQEELSWLKAHLQLLAALPVPVRSSLFQLLQQVLCDRSTLSILENTLEELVVGRVSSWAELSGPLCEEGRVRALLDLLQKAPPPHADLIATVHLLLSAMEEMTDAGLAQLCACCSPPVLKTLQDLVSGESALADEEVCQRVELLFSSSNVVLRREMGRLWAELGAQAGLRPLVMCIAVQGLATLGL